MLVKKLHLWVGGLGMAGFLMSGIYFQVALHGLQGMEDSQRLLLRTSHVYLFMSCFINVIFGFYYQPPSRLKPMTVFNQSLIMLSPFFIAYGFIFETLGNPGINRAIGSIGVIMLFVWLLHISMGRMIRRV